MIAYLEHLFLDPISSFSLLDFAVVTVVLIGSVIGIGKAIWDQERDHARDARGD